jgi:chlorobactene glucosyltransferase
MAFAVLIFATGALIVIALLAVTNTLLLRRLGHAPSTVGQPFVSVLIPARNESGVIGRTVRQLLEQDYSRFEVIVLDDSSADGTAQIALAAGEGDTRLRVMNGAALLPGWLGKNWACHQLASTARGDWLLFSDADVIWKPGALRALVADMVATRADLLTVWPTQQTETWAERLVVPLMALAVIGYLPLPLVHHTRWPAFAAANGQCLLFRRAAYQRIGGHAAVRDHIVEDVALARRIKAHDLRLRMADAAGLIACRMYAGWPQVRDGFAKNILAGHGDSLALLAVSTIFHWLVFVLPWWWLLTGWPDRLWPLCLIALGVGVRMLSAAATRQRVADGLLLPVSAVLMTVIAARAVWWRLRFGGPRWKDRTITRQRVPESATHG